ncbi:MAG: hypothetical protein HN742_29595 [Lentisphaerae bacterium]|nr:hypothetical protein [Lentisphaerota bacterium]MBT5607639.1 hypothetical protein [Lentisphaerota bacterium]MBT7053874.1 hypothetical protein [Lentisphaerota bacterium]MBT7846063.1 hypothetical protein [Lentisphaerota bacterium]
MAPIRSWSVAIWGLAGSACLTAGNNLAAAEPAHIATVCRQYLQADGERKTALEAPLRAYAGPIATVIADLERAEPRDWGLETPNAKPQTFLHPEYKGTFEDALLFFHVPPEYETARPIGLLIVMHGGGHGSPPEAGRIYVTEHARVGLRPCIDHIPFITVAPSAPPAESSARWNLPETEAYLSAVIAECQYRFNIDPDRVVLAGMSMGGFGAFGMCQRMADRIAAGIAISGAWSCSHFPCLTGTPFCMIHGAKDAVPGKRPRFTDVFYARSAHRLLEEAGIEHLYLEHKGGHNLYKDQVGEALAESFKWVAAKRRDPYFPHVVAMDPRGAYLNNRTQLSAQHCRWVSILEKREGTLPVSAVTRTGPGPKWKETEEAFAQQGFRLTTRPIPAALVDARLVARNRFEVETTNVKRLALWLAPEMVDFSQPVTVVLDGQVRVYRDLRPTLFDALRSYERSRDWRLVYPCELVLEIPETGREGK